MDRGERGRRRVSLVPGAEGAWAGWALVAVFVAITVVVAALGQRYLRHLRHGAEADKTAELEAIADLKRDQIVAWVNERRGDVRALADAQSFAPLAARVVSGTATAAEVAVVRQRLALEVKGYEIRAALLVGVDGAVRMAEGAEVDTAVSPTLGKTVAECITSGGTESSELHRIGAGGPVYLDVAAPLRRGNEIVGAVVLRAAADDFLFPLLQRWPMPSDSAESLLVRRDGDDVLFLNTLRHDRHPALSLRIPISNSQLPATVALLEGDGVVKGPDYRGVPVVAALRRVPGTPWAMVAKIDEAELFAPAREQIAAIAAVVGLLIVVAALAVSLVWRSQRLASVRRELAAAHALAEAEAELSQHEELFETVFDASAVGKSLTAADGRLLRVNPAFAQMLGYTVEEMQRLDFATLTHPDDVAASRECIRCLLAGERDTYHLEKRYLHRDGHEVWSSVNSRLVREASGAPRFFVTSIEDVTERVEMAGQLDALVAALRRSNEDLERFAYVASHDLQEPLRMVVSYMDLLARRYGDRLDGDAAEFMGYAVDGARRMQRMISDLLAYSRVNTRGEAFGPVDLGEVAAEVVQELDTAAREVGATVEVGPLPTVSGDRSQLAMVLRNLIGNALKFHGEAAPEVRISATASDGWCTVAVADNGIGIAPDHQERAFVIFQRLNSQVRFPGSGIGLSIAKRVVERHGGRIWIESQPGRGSTFFFALPVFDTLNQQHLAPEGGSDDASGTQ